MIETVASASGEIVSLDEAKQQLRVWDAAEDARVRLLLEAARAYCEGWGEITLRLTATRTLKCSGWPSDGWVLRHPPVTAVTSVKYYDAAGVEQTLSSSLYRLHYTPAGYAQLLWADDASGFTLPATADRPDAVAVTYTTGWGTQEAAPADAKAAVLLTLTHLYGEDDTRNLAYAERAAKQLLVGRSAWTYS